ncbi:MAG: protein kinase [Pyrinomonadaceae bacterium]
MPEQLGHYRLLRPLGAGGMGEVYLATDVRLKRQVAIKILPAHLTADESLVERFLREAMTASALNHPNILTIYDLGNQGEIRYIASEFVEGLTLRDRMKQGPVEIDEMVRIVLQVAQALGAAHGAGIVHRDIKPENIMIRTDGYVKVLDFGIAKLSEADGFGSSDTWRKGSTAPGSIIGTVQYMSPEQARGLTVDGRSDLFSLGVLIYELITGTTPFAAATIGDTLANILRAEPKPIADSVANVPKVLAAIVDRALRKDRENRYGTAAELLADLRAVTGTDTPLSPRRSIDGIDRTAEPETKLFPATSREVSRVSQVRPGRTRRAIDSLAVLPFANDLGDPETDYLADGITESIINSLSVLPKMRVVPRSTAFRYQSSALEPIEIGRELGVRAIFTGRVLQVADSLVFTTELIDVVNESQIWGEQYRRKLTDIFALQNEIAEDISEKLKLRLTGAQKKQLQKRYTVNTEAYQYYLKGRYFVITKRTEEWIKKGIENFQLAIDLDPNYALAYAGIAEAYGFLASSTGGWRPQDAFPKAKAAAEKALQLDDGLPEAHCSLGFTRLLFDWDFPAAQAEFQRAMRLNPNFPTAIDGYGFYLKVVGQFDEAIEKGKQALALDPLSAFAHVSLGYAYYFARDFQKAIDECNRALEMDRRLSFAYRTIGQSLMQLGRFDEGLTALHQAVEFATGGSVFDSALGFAFGVAGHTDKALVILRQLKTQRQQQYVPAFDISVIHLALGQTDEALEWLSVAVDERSGFIPFLNVEPMVDILRPDPRFQEILRRVGF